MIVSRAGGLPDYCSPLNYKAPAMIPCFTIGGDGTFEDATISAGLNKAFGNGLEWFVPISITWETDIFVATTRCLTSSDQPGQREIH